MEHVLRQCLIALHLAKRAGLSEAEQPVVFYASMVAWVGCHVDAYEQAKWFGDDLALKSDSRLVDLTGPTAQRLFMVRHLAATEPILRRVGVGVDFARHGGIRDAHAMFHNHWLAADDLAQRLGLGAPVRDSVEQTFERWDGHGVPRGAKGADIHLTSQMVNLADVVEVFHRLGGVESAINVARERSGTQFARQAARS